MFKLKELAVRAGVTVVEAVLGVLVAAGTTDLNVDTGKAALVAGVAAGLSVLYNAAKQYLAEQPA